MADVLRETFANEADAFSEPVVAAATRFVNEHELKAAKEILKFKLSDAFAARLPGLDAAGAKRLRAALEQSAEKKETVRSALFGQRGVR